MTGEQSFTYTEPDSARSSDSALGRGLQFPELVNRRIWEWERYCALAVPPFLPFAISFLALVTVPLLFSAKIGRLRGHLPNDSACLPSKPLRSIAPDAESQTVSYDSVSI